MQLFDFACHRCGHCCRVGSGHVWVKPADVPRMAAVKGVSAEAFTRSYVKQVGARLSLREKTDGSCCMLEGNSHCSIYADRPDQCSRFPYWDAILNGGEALEMAASYCPGLDVYPDAETARRVLLEFSEMLSEWPVPHSESSMEWGEASSLEVDHAILWGTEAPDVFSKPVAQPLFCRGVSSEQQATARRRFQVFAQQHQYPWSYGEWRELFQRRLNGWNKRGGLCMLSQGR